ncbi:MAG TPA: nuclear transport factor 2 family protein [Pyrinomonadaceae bacterium]|jgi:beta-aspartyl-peptidase (threonine type)|nr:nuclear transport factor 2 family protein [Pyrinomonadaceae bacterium]
MRRFFVLIAALAASASVLSVADAQQNRAVSKSRRDAKAVREVRAVLDAQVAAWNRGDIDGFMEGYWQSPETVFVSGDSLTRGWQTVLDRYKKSYDSREKMGTLSFLEIDIKALGPRTVIATGRWQLMRVADTPHGRFTLIFRRTPEGWRITHDHTSSAT